MGIPANDNRRMLGALVDIVISVTLFVSMIVTVAVAGRDEMLSFGQFLAIAAVFWALDITLYAVLVSRSGASLGNRITATRVLSAGTGDHLSIGRAAIRYFGRRAGAMRVLELVRLRNQVLSGAAAHSKNGSAPTGSFADRCANSVVVRARR